MVDELEHSATKADRIGSHIGFSTRRAFMHGLGAAMFVPTATAQPALSPSPMNDVIVVVPGILGSILTKDNKEIWGPSAGAVANGLLTFGNNLDSLSLASEISGKDDSLDGVSATAIFPDVHLIPGLWKIDGYSRLSQSIHENFQITMGTNYFEFAYDWRRDNRVAARRLAALCRKWLEDWRQSSHNPDAKLILVAHSMGGLVCRYFLECLGGWRDTKMLVTLGTPYRGSLKALDALSNGLNVSVAGVNIVDLSKLVRSFASVYQLLPTFPCYDDGSGVLAKVEDARNIPNLDHVKVLDATAFHREIELGVVRNAADPGYASSRYAIHSVTGTFQNTMYTGINQNGRVLMRTTYPNPQPGEVLDGDGTVPRVSTLPIEPAFFSKGYGRVYFAEMHSSIQNSFQVLVHLSGLLSEAQIKRDRFRQRLPRLQLNIEDAYVANAPVRLSCRSDGPPLKLRAMVDFGIVE